VFESTVRQLLPLETLKSAHESNRNLWCWKNNHLD
jgi:hypothetical protein